MQLNIPVITIPIIAKSPAPEVIFPKETMVPPSAGWTTMPAPSKPKSAINNPIPTEIAL